jgi:RNA polymerase sigma-70 factor (ECF subfamily)
MNRAPQTEISDAALLEQFYVHKDNAILGVLLRRYTTLLLGVCMKYLKNEEAAKDAVQQIFLKVIIELSKYKVTYFKSWLYTVARHYCLMQLRSEKHQHKPVKIDDVFLEEEELPQLEAVQQEQLYEWIEQGLNALKEEQKLCVSLFYLQGLSYRFISEQTGFTLAEVKSHIQNGKRNIKLFVSTQLSHV